LAEQLTKKLKKQMNTENKQKPQIQRNKKEKTKTQRPKKQLEQSTDKTKNYTEKDQ
jgi:hypothetical protein